MPYYEPKPRGDKPIICEGAIFDVTVHTSGTPKFSEKVTKIVEAESIEVAIVGDFVGTGAWTFEPTD
jgi:hypothetical protein